MLTWLHEKKFKPSQEIERCPSAKQSVCSWDLVFFPPLVFAGMRVCACVQLLQPGEAPLHAVRNMTLNGDLEVRIFFL